MPGHRNNPEEVPNFRVPVDEFTALTGEQVDAARERWNAIVTERINFTQNIWQNATNNTFTIRTGPVGETWAENPDLIEEDEPYIEDDYEEDYEEEYEEGEEMARLTVRVPGPERTRQTTELPRFWRGYAGAPYQSYLAMNIDRISQNNPNCRSIDSDECHIYPKILKELKDWADNNNLFLTIESNRAFDFYARNMELRFNVPFPESFYAHDREFALNEAGFVDADEFKIVEMICENCEHEINNYTVACPECSNIVKCPSCATKPAREVSYIDGFGWGCGTCCATCLNCNEFYFGDYCQECDPHSYCEGCDTNFSTDEFVEIAIFANLFSDEENSNVETDHHSFCENCVTHYCQVCGSYIDGERYEMVGEIKVCLRCSLRGQNDETFDPEDGEDVQGLERIPGREMIRRVGVEIEGANGSNRRGRDSAGGIIAYNLYKEGLSIYDHVLPWNANGEGSFAYMKHDGSVDWEMVVGPINMADKNEMKAFNKTIKVVKEAIKNKDAKLDLRAGTHIHVGAEKVGLSQAYNLHVLFSYLEDVMYRLGAAKWPVHRMLVNDTGRDYCKKSEKENTKLAFANRYKEDRYYGLSFSNYFQAMMGNCRCGARVYGLWNECTCGNLGKCTFEFRLFNATANVTKIHAYLALCQSLVAKAVDMEEIKGDQEFPVLSFIEKRTKDMTENEKERLYREWEPRIKFIANELPLTEKEKNSIYYCIMNSELEPVGKVFVNEGGN